VVAGSSKRVSRRSFLGGTLVVLAGSALLSACGGAAPPTPAPAKPADKPAAAPAAAQAPPAKKPTVELKLWHGFTGGNNTETTNKMIKNYSETNPDGINISVDVFPWVELFAKYATAFRAGNPPEIVYLLGQNLADFATRGMLLELTPDLEKDVGALPSGDQYPIAQQNGIYKGKRWMIALDLLPRGYFFRADHVEKAGLDAKSPPRSMDQWLTWMKKLQTPDHFGTGLPASGPQFGLTRAMRNTLWFQNGVSFYSEDLRKAAISTPQGAEVLEWLTKVINSENVTNPTIQDPRQDFLKDKVSSVYDGAWQVPLYVGEKIPFFTARYPKFYGKDVVDTGSNLAGVTNIKDRDKIAAGMKYHKWVMQNPATFFDALGTVPSNRKYAEGDEFRKHPWYPHLKPFLDTLETAVPYPQHELSTKLESANAYDVGMQQVMAGKLTAKEGLARLEKEWNDILAEGLK
jgi:ABC-type glycerol-3-phosphate transport system substrate-binding protein